MCDRSWVVTHVFDLIYIQQFNFSLLLVSACAPACTLGLRLKNKKQTKKREWYRGEYRLHPKYEEEQQQTQLTQKKNSNAEFMAF